jgi:FkbM family methyltransferase
MSEKMKDFAKSLMPPLIYGALHKIKTRHSEADNPKLTRYRIGDYLITIPADHPLPAYQSAHRLYDRFLPVLCRHLSPAGVIVDIGANVGDTVAAIMQTCKNPIVAIEGYSPYFELLCTNLAEIDSGDRVTPIQAVVGPGAQTGTLVASHGTAVLSNSGSSQIKSLDEVLENWAHGVVLLKTDTDGLDADVILSGMNTIRASKPILFWEGGTLDPISFERMYEEIGRVGYDRFWVFDNFGNLMLSECGIKQLKDLDLYVASQYRDECTRSISYIDVLASTNKTTTKARNAVAEYRKFIVT